ncbi:MAG: methyltransferase domain-containing protein [Coprobacillus cateniformis]|uniref:methyltransferase domain-containing protein n=1 Tax=Longibaculum muris TaxID=1796628 RepID=UPI003AB64B22|nr:methyltransferase domain-containing protein [Coprobacillus cateniformis]
MDCVSNIKNNEQIRESLIELKSLAGNDSLIKNDQELKEKLIDLLKNDDPKIRKNSAILLGYYQDTVGVLLDAYRQEKTDYVKDAYLKGISMQDCHRHIQELKLIQSQLIHFDSVPTKHIQAQLKILNPLILKNQTHKKKIIKLKHDPVDVILTTLPYYQFVLFDSVLHLKYKPVTQGVLVRSDSLYDLQNIRAYKDMIIPLQSASGMDISLEAIVAGLKRSNLSDVLDRLYDDHSLFYFRVVDGLREKNAPLIKKVSEKLFEMYPEILLNTTENYDIEIILREIKRGKVNAYLRLTHLKNPRFNYRKEVIATSLQPYVAATLVELAKPYMKENGKVLDPFVGCGTLLIERNFALPSKFAMGIDIYGLGIEAARKNTKLAGQNIYYVHKDALRFVNNEMFDEIITDMPTLSQVNDAKQLKDIYDRFFERIRRLVKPGGYVFIYTSEISLVRKNLRLQEGYLTLIEHYEIPRGKNMFYFFIMQVK